MCPEMNIGCIERVNSRLPVQHQSPSFDPVLKVVVSWRTKFDPLWSLVIRKHPF